MADGGQIAAPAWDASFPGRYARELAELAAADANPRVVPEALAAGLLVVELDWPTETGPAPLRATYPECFPYFRPIVALRERPFPKRHCHPVDGTLCLLGRNTAQWQPNLTLRQLLEEQLQRALAGDTDEDPQGEPAEMWWNAAALEGTYVLVDSAWDVGDVESGVLKLAYRILPDGPAGPRVQAAVLEVQDLAGNTLGVLSSPPPRTLMRRMTVPWVRRREVLLPADPLAELSAWFAESKFLTGRAPLTEFGGGRRGQVAAIAYDSELQQNTLGLGWLFPFRFGPGEAFKKQRPGRKAAAVFLGLLKTLRSGRADLGARIPHVHRLESARIAVVGLGAIGSPIAVSLARNRCGELHLLEYDEVDPGITVRWARGASAWGLGKLEALSELVGQDYPATRVVPHDHLIGAGSADGSSDLEGLRAMIAACDVVVDASASFGVTQLLGDLCRATGKPLVVAYATPSVEGGIVATYRPAGGCPVCLEHAWHTGDIARPPGFDALGALAQPPGCSEATFTGADFEMQELSLQASRAAIACLDAAKADEPSEVLTLSLRDEGTPPPIWRRDPLQPHPACTCRPAR